MNWLLDDWHRLIPAPWANIALAIIAVICGSIVGAEREKKEKPAGFRTLTLVSLGSAVFTMVSFAIAGKGADPGRVAAQIVTGIGFLGAGSILRGAGGVTGLTTAATIWVMAATGMVVGLGYAVAGLALSFLVLAVLTIIASWEQKHFATCQFTTAVVTFDPTGGKALVKIEEILDDFHVVYRPNQFQPVAEGLMQLRLTYCQAHRHHKEFLPRLASLPEVREIRHETEGRNDGVPPSR
jgi:putative Mg2+ transporter-C (MgtC) family protein